MEVHGAYFERLKKYLLNQRDAITTMTRLFNSFAWLNSTRADPVTIEQLYGEFATSMKSFIESTSKLDRSGAEKLQQDLLDIASRIDSDELLSSVTASFDADRLVQKIGQITLSYKTAQKLKGLCTR